MACAYCGVDILCELYGKEQSAKNPSLASTFSVIVADRFQRKDEHALEKVFRGY